MKLFSKKKDRISKHDKAILELYEKGLILNVDNDVNNKKYIEAVKNGKTE